MDNLQSTMSVSVIIPCYKCMDTIDRALSSVLSQTILPLEIILVDDFSCDGTLEKIKELATNYGTQWIKIVELNKNMGPGSARNAGWNIAKGSYIAFLDADDSWHPQKLEIQYSWMANHSNISITGHASALYQPETPLQHYEFRKVSKVKFLFRNLFPTRSVMLLRDLPFRFTEQKKYSEDYLLWLQILLSEHAGFYSKSILAFSYKNAFGDSGLSANLFSHQIGELSTYAALYKQRLISFSLLCILYFISTIKFIRRLSLQYLRILLNKYLN